MTEGGAAKREGFLRVEGAILAALVDQREDETEEEPLRSREEEGLPSSSEGVEEEGGGRSPYKPPSMATEVWKLHKIHISGNPKTQNTLTPAMAFTQ